LAAQRWLVLWRHGEAEQSAGQDDRARALTRRGLGQARAAAGRIAALSPPPSVLVYSSAPRAAQTADCAAAALALPDRARHAVDALYLASPQALRESLARHAGDAPCVLLVGHNPGLSELGAALDPGRAGVVLDTAAWWRIALDDPMPWRNDT